MRKGIYLCLFVVLMSLTVCDSVWAPEPADFAILTPIPTMTEWGMMILTVLLSMTGLFFIRDRIRA